VSIFGTFSNGIDDGGIDEPCELPAFDGRNSLGLFKLL